MFYIHTVNYCNHFKSQRNSLDQLNGPIKVAIVLIVNETHHAKPCNVLLLEDKKV